MASFAVPQSTRPSPGSRREKKGCCAEEVIRVAVYDTFQFLLRSFRQLVVQRFKFTSPKHESLKHRRVRVTCRPRLASPPPPPGEGIKALWFLATPNNNVDQMMHTVQPPMNRANGVMTDETLPKNVYQTGDVV
uniref:Uncharacterized protein n=1 Tax=Steinernema glaseri TaxID=37863 RepID=A0A1I8A8P7_9BILA